jgi:hypothetical protein
MLVSNSDQGPQSYEVGYGKPPRKGQFKPGQSGNPHGRPKGAKSLKAAFEKVASELVTVTIAGQPTTMTFLEAVVNTAFHYAANGNKALLAVVTEWVNKYGYSASDEKALSEVGKVIKHGGSAYVKTLWSKKDIDEFEDLEKRMVPWNQLQGKFK